MKQRYTINDCCGQHISDVVIDIPEDSNPYAHLHDALAADDREQYTCEGCYDAAYSVRPWPKGEGIIL